MILDLVIIEISGATLAECYQRPVTAGPQVPRPVPPRLPGPRPRLAPQVLARPRVPRVQLPRGGARVPAVPARLQVLSPRDGGPRTQRL